MKKPAGGPLGSVTSQTTIHALVCGLALGGVVWLMADMRQGNAVSQAMALLLVFTAPVSFVCHALGRYKQSPTTNPRPAPHAWVCSLGVGLLATLHGLNLLVYTQ